jgi:hypothetical protein
MNRKQRIIEKNQELLIHQYQQPKAQALIEIITKNEYGDFGAFSLEDFYDLEKASEKWLDKIGALWGANRVDLQQFGSNDEFYRLYIKMNIIQATSNFSRSALAKLYDVFFGRNVVIVFNQANTMMIDLVVETSFVELIVFLYNQEKLPIPNEVGIKVIVKQSETQFCEILAIATEDIVLGRISQEDLDNLRIQEADKSFIAPEDVETSQVEWLKNEDIINV